MSLTKILAYIEAQKSKQTVSLVISEIELAPRYGCTLTMGRKYQLTSNGKYTGKPSGLAGYVVLENKYILQDDVGGMFLVFLLECQVTQKLGLIMASKSEKGRDMLSQVLAAGDPCSAV
jgi:hypothetical protein